MLGEEEIVRDLELYIPFQEFSTDEWSRIPRASPLTETLTHLQF